MSSVKRLQAAIEKLEALQAASHNWRVQLSSEDGPEVIHDFDTEGHGPGTGTLAWTISAEGAINIVTLHRTVDVQLSILTAGLTDDNTIWTVGGEPVRLSDITDAALTLADAILGSDQ